MHLDDPRFDPNVGGARGVLVWLDGVEQKQVETYDMDEGFVIRAALTDAGDLQLTPARDEILRERVAGVVTVAWVPATIS